MSSNRATPTPRRGLAAVLGLLLMAETVYFGGRVLAAAHRLQGEGAYYAGDYDRAWRWYEASMRAGGNAEGLTLDRAELLLNGLDMQSLGLKVNLPVPGDEALREARGMIVRLLATTPYRAYYWSLAADLLLNEARATRRGAPLDLSALSEDPRENLLPEEIGAIAALEEAARREPNNYIYRVILAEQFLQWNLPDLAAPQVREAVRLYPDLNSHIQLTRPQLDPSIVNAAVEGFTAARAGDSMVAPDQIDCDAGKFLLAQGRHADAREYFLSALRFNPEMADALGQLGVAEFMQGNYAEAREHLDRATKILPESASLWFHLGRTRLKMGDHEGGKEALRTARMIDSRSVKYFHVFADLLEADGAVRDAERQFQAAAHLNPGQNGAWRALFAFYGRHPELRGATRAICSRLATLKSAREVYDDQCRPTIPEGP